MPLTDSTLFVELLGKLGLAAIVILVYRFVRHSHIRAGWHTPATGLAFALGAVLGMLAPIPLSEGIFIDARNIMVALAAVFGGLSAGLIAAIICAAVRLLMGGAGVDAGLAAIAGSLLIGLGYRSIFGERRSFLRLFTLGLAMSLTLLLPFLVMPAGTVGPLLADSWPMIALGNLIGTLAMGGILAVEDREELNLEEMKTAATTDPLTGLKNRRAFDGFMRSCEAMPVAGDRAFVAILIDFDHFKAINDTYGHFAGDMVLRQAAELVIRRLRGSDLALRFGGDEFLMILPDCSASRGLSIAEELCRKIAQCRFESEGRAFSVTVSIGVAAGASEADNNLALVDAADKALYRAKQDGRNQVHLMELAAAAATAEMPLQSASK